jgi:2-polyprenyl-3-methyl-5-hydroxy-6-metoxy-1,4-benzoquinol methylase
MIEKIQSDDVAISCRFCNNADLDPVLNLGDHPISHRLLSDPASEEYRHLVDLRFCGDCGLIQLIEPISPEKLYSEYFCLSSWKYQPHSESVAALVETLPGLTKDCSIVEVGSNDGLFLASLADKGYEKLIGIEPAEDAFAEAQKRGVNTLNRYFNESMAVELCKERGQCDLLISRQVLEHVIDLAGFLQSVVTLVKEGGYVIIEVPNFEFCLDTHDYSGIWEEHANYFTPDTLEHILSTFGIAVKGINKYNYSGEAMVIHGRVEGGVQKRIDMGLLAGKVMNYRNMWPEFCGAFATYLQELGDRGKSVAVYGAGCRACSLINFAAIGPYLKCVFDDQSEKQGAYMPGSRLPILPGDTLPDSGIDICLLAVNDENEEKVVAKHRSFLERGGKFLSVLPPSKVLLPFWHAEN